MQCELRAAHIHESKIRLSDLCGALWCLWSLAEACSGMEESTGTGLKHDPAATGKERSGEAPCPASGLPLGRWRGDSAFASLHSSAGGCAADHPPSTSSPEASAPPLAAERTQTHTTQRSFLIH